MPAGSDAQFGEIAHPPRLRWRCPAWRARELRMMCKALYCAHRQMATSTSPARMRHSARTEVQYPDDPLGHTSERGGLPVC